MHGKISKHVPSGWCVHSTFAYGDIRNPLKLYRGRDCVEKFVEYIEEEVKRLYEKFPQKPMIELTNALKRGHEVAEKCHICLKEFLSNHEVAEKCHICLKEFLSNDLDNRKVRDHCYYTSFYRVAAHNKCNLKYQIPDYVPLYFIT